MIASVLCVDVLMDNVLFTCLFDLKLGMEQGTSAIRNLQILPFSCPTLNGNWTKTLRDTGASTTDEPQTAFAHIAVKSIP